MTNSEIDKSFPYTMFKLLLMLITVAKDKYIVASNKKTNKLGTLITKSIIEDIITFSEGMLKINDKQEIIALDKEALKQDMIDFIICLGFNYDILKDDFLKNFDKSKVPKFYSMTDYKYVPFVLMEYAKNENFIKDIKVEINDTSLFADNSCSINDLLSFEIIIDITSLLDNITKNSKSFNKITKKQNIKYSDAQKRIILFLKKEVKEYGCFGIDYYTIQKYIKSICSSCNKTLCDLNKKFQIINNTSEKLIKFDRGLGQYSINKAILNIT